MQLIDVKQLNQDGRCVFGTTITLLNLSDDSEIIYQIVGEDESDIESGKIHATLQSQKHYWVMKRAMK